MQSWDLTSLDLPAHQPRILRSDAEARVIAIHLPAGEELQEHEVHERAYLVVIAGDAEIDADGGTESAGPGFVAHFDPQERRTVRARSDTRLIMVLAPWPGAGHPSQVS